MDKKENDVIEDDSSNPKLDANGNPIVEDDPSGDKEENLRKLRKKVEDLEEENKKLRSGDQGTDKPDPSVKILFDRDLKKATIRWKKDHKISPEIFEKVREKVSLKGDEIDEEIYEKFTEAYESLPEVKAERDKALLEQGRAEGRKEFTNEEMDLGTGGGEPTGTDTTPKFTPKEKKILDVFGVPQDARKKIKKT